MTHLDFTTALIRMGRYRIGIQEACALFCLGNGATSSQVAAATKSDRNTTAIRLGHLRRKKFVTSSRQQDGTVMFKPSAAGRDIIRQTLKLKPQTKDTPEA